MIRLFTLAITILSFCSTLHAQSLQRDSLIGVWICSEASVIGENNIPKEELAAMPTLKSVFISSKFVFKSNGLFELQLPKNAPPSFNQLSFLNNRKWSISQQSNLIYIGPPNENLMQIQVVLKEGIKYFILSDTPLLLRMQKL